MHEDKPDKTPLTHDAADRSAGGGKLSADMRGALEKLFAATTELLRLEPDNLRWKKEVATLSNLLGKPDPQRTEEQRKTRDPQKAAQSRKLLEQYRALPLSERQALAEKLLGQETEEQRKKDELWKQFKAQFRAEVREKYGKPSPDTGRQAPLLGELPAVGSEDAVSTGRSHGPDSSTDLGVLSDPVWLTQAVETTLTLLEAEPNNPRYQRQLVSLKKLLDNATKK